MAILEKARKLQAEQRSAELKNLAENIGVTVGNRVGEVIGQIIGGLR